MHRRLTKLSLMCSVLALLYLAAPPAILAQATTDKQTFTFPVDDTTSVSDPNNPLYLPCLGEDVHITGTVLETIHTTIDDQGGFHLKVSQSTRLIGEGLTTGDTYQVSGPLSFVVYDIDANPDNGARAVTFHNVVAHIVGPGGDAKALLLVLFRFTTNANGVTTVEIDDFDVRCH